MIAKFTYYALVLPLSYLPLRVLYLLTDFFYLLLISVVPYRRAVVRKNLLNSFPEKSLKERKAIERKFYRHFTDLLAEGIKNLSISKKQLQRRYLVANPEIMEKLYSEKKSVLLVSGHYNNWEWLISAQNFLFPHQAMGIGMPMSSKFWDKKINERRSRFGMQVVHAKNFREAIVQSGDTPLAILVLSDQSPGDSLKSYWMEFLNQQSAILFGAEKLAHDYDFTVVGFVTEKAKRGHYKMHLKLITDEPKKCSWGSITEAHIRMLEAAIIEKPEYWIWSHKRWKRDVPEDLENLKIKQRERFMDSLKIRQ